jgi:hypothetical protein
MASRLLEGGQTPHAHRHVLQRWASSRWQLATAIVLAAARREAPPLRSAALLAGALLDNRRPRWSV